MKSKMVKNYTDTTRGHKLYINKTSYNIYIRTINDAYLCVLSRDDRNIGIYTSSDNLYPFYGKIELEEVR